MTELNKFKRIEEIDIAKGICILLMVIGHSNLPPYMTHFIYAFHMPFFFFISGVTSNINIPFKNYLRKKIDGLAVPFLIYYVIHIPCYAFVNNESIIDQFITEANNGISGALWFIPILFLTTITIWFIPQNKYFEIPAILIFAAISSILCIKNVHLPWNLTIFPLSTSFVLLGRVMSEGIKILIKNTNKWFLFTSFTILSIITFIISSQYQLAMYFDKIEPILPIMVAALLGSVMVIISSKIIRIINKHISTFLIYTGKNTFVFIAFSQIILKFENLHIRDYAILKYAILFISLYIICFIKNQIKIAKQLRL